MNNDSIIHIAGIDIPLKLVDAANNNNLVIFAGAGVSPCISGASVPLDTPLSNDHVDAALKNIPNKHDNITSLSELSDKHKKYQEHGRFEIIVKEALDSENIPNAHKKITSLAERLDRVQNDVQKYGVNVKQLVRDVLKKQKNGNENHQTLLNFFKDKDNIRIVTTNYDHNFCEAAQALKLESLQQYCQPILPFGDKFKGIVYLHGRIDDTDSMIMTQTDFSEAYLNRQRTRLFLQELFNQYTVLFVGLHHKVCGRGGDA